MPDIFLSAVTEDCNSVAQNVPQNVTANVSDTLVLPQNSTTAPVLLNSCPPGFPYWWQGIAFFLQNLLIFLRCAPHRTV